MTRRLHHKFVGKSQCPNCLGPNDMATHVDGGDVMPNPGDFAVCLHCGQILRYGEGLQLRASSEKEAAEQHAAGQISAVSLRKLRRASWAAMMNRN